MANFSTNAVQHMIIAKTTDVKLIDAKTGKEPTSKAIVDKFYIQYKNAFGDTMRSDIIEADKIRNFKATDYKVGTPRKITIKFKQDKLAANTEYILKVLIREVMSGSQEDQMTGVVSFTTSSATAPETLKTELANGLAEQLNKMYGAKGKLYNKLEYPLFEAVGSTGDLVITEVGDVLKPWILGKVQLRNYNFDVFPMPVNEVSPTGNTNFESMDWIDTSDVTKGLMVKVEGGTLGNGNGRVVADMEYFYHGDIGDFYRMNCYPLNITTTYMADPNKTYNLINLAFYFRGEATSPQASEKQLLIACEKTTADAVYTGLKDKIGKIIKGEAPVA